MSKEVQFLFVSQFNKIKWLNIKLLIISKLKQRNGQVLLSLFIVFCKDLLSRIYRTTHADTSLVIFAVVSVRTTSWRWQ